MISKTSGFWSVSSIRFQIFTSSPANQHIADLNHLQDLRFLVSGISRFQSTYILYTPRILPGMANGPPRNLNLGVISPFQTGRSFLRLSQT